MGVAWADTKNGQGRGARDRQLLERAQVALLDRHGRGLPRRVAEERRRADARFLDLTFGVLFFDADLDGRMDLLLANGHVEPTVQEVQKDVAYRQAPILYRNAGDGRFAALGARAGDLAKPLVARGAAYADLDGDGDLDVVLVENGGPGARLSEPDGRAEEAASACASWARAVQPRRRRRARHRDDRRPHAHAAGLGRTVLPLRVRRRR